MTKKQKADPKRPYRLYDSLTHSALRWRYYVYPKNAHLGALIEMRWSKIGSSIEVVDIRNGKLLGQYMRRVNSIDFTGA